MVRVEAGSARDADRRRGKHSQQVAGQSLACLPVLEANDAAVRGVELAEAEVGLLGDDDVGVVVLEAEPRDVGLRVVVTFDLTVFMLAPPPQPSVS
jgi:hypothetical protein